MKHVTTCLSTGGDIGMPDAHDAAFNADSCVTPGVLSPSASNVLTASAPQVRAAAARFGIGPARFDRYAVRRWGKKWHLHADDWHQALDEMERYRNDPEGFIDKVDTYLRPEGRLV